MTNLKQYKASSGYGSFFWKSSYCDDGGFKMFCCAFDPNSDHYLRCDQSNVKKAKKIKKLMKILCFIWMLKKTKVQCVTNAIKEKIDKILHMISSSDSST